MRMYRIYWIFLYLNPECQKAFKADMFWWRKGPVFTWVVPGGTLGKCAHMKAACFLRPLNCMTTHSIFVRSRMKTMLVPPSENTGISFIVLGGPPPTFTQRLSAWENTSRSGRHSFATANSLPLPRTLTRHRGGEQ